MKKKLMMAAAVLSAMMIVLVCGVCVTAAAVTEGGLAWSYGFSGSQMGGTVSSPVVSGENVYIPAGSSLYKFSRSTGEKISSVSLSGSIGMNKLQPSVGGPGGQYMFVALNDGYVDIVDIDTMTLKNTVKYDGRYEGSQSLTPVIYDKETDSIYLGSWKGGNKDRTGGGVFARVDDYTSADYKVTVLADSAQYSGLGGFYWSGASVCGSYVIFGSDTDACDDGTTQTGNAKLFVYDKTSGTSEPAVVSKDLEGSGSICSTPVWYDGNCYFTSKAGELHKAAVSGSCGDLALDVRQCSVLAGTTTCTPLIVNEASGDFLYVASVSGTKGMIEKIDLKKLSIVKRSETPAETKTLAYDQVSGHVFATYNARPGGICTFNGDTGRADDYFIPDSSMQQYCISAIAVDDEGTLYYANDSSSLMAVKARDAAADVRKKSLKLPSSVSVKLYGHDDVKVSWSKVSGASGYRIKYRKSSSSGYTFYKDVEGLSVNAANLADGVKYYFSVSPYVTAGGQKYFMDGSSSSKISSGIYTLKKTSISSIKKSSKKYVSVKWKNISGESGYQIQRSKYKNKKFSTVKTVSSKYSSAKIKTTKGKKYYYRVRAYSTVDGKKIPAPWSSVKSYKLR